MKKLISLLLCMALMVSLIPGAFAAEGDVYLALGDSITAGTALNGGEPAFPQILAESNGWELTNLGVNGQTAEGLLEQIRQGSIDELIAAAKVITITVGGNDMMHLLYELIAQDYNDSFTGKITAEDVIPIMLNPEDDRMAWVFLIAVGILNGNEKEGIPPFAEREEFQNRIEEYTQQMQQVMACIRERNPEATVIVTTQYNPYRDFTDVFELVDINVDAGARKLNSAIEANAAEFGYLVADVYTVFVNSEEPLWNASSDPLVLDFHPNARGHEVIAELIQEIVDQNPQEPEPVVNPFVDVKEEDYFFESVLWAVERGITNGTSADEFSPEENCTRAQVVTFLWRAAGKPESTSRENPFRDLDENEYYYDAVLWAVEKEITNGTSATEFSPEEDCTRGQIVTFLYRGMKDQA